MKGKSYPRTIFWNKDIDDADRLQIINKQGFPKDAILASLGIANHPLTRSFGITDEAEIKKRLGIMQYLLKNPQLRAKIEEVMSCQYRNHLHLPRTEQAFLKFFDTEEEHNPYWKIVREIAEALDTEDAPESFQEFGRHVKRHYSDEETEKTMAQKIITLLENVTGIDGLLHFEIQDVNKAENTCFCIKRNRPSGNDEYEEFLLGFKQYATALAKSKRRKCPNWTRHFLAKWTGIRFLSKKWTDFLNALSLFRIKRGLIIKNRIPDSVLIDLPNAVGQELQKLELSEELENTKVKVAFQYNRRGLEFQICSIEPRYPRTLYTDTIDFQFSDFEGYPLKLRKRAFRAKKEYSKIMARQSFYQEKGLLYHRIESQRKNFFSRIFTGKSPHMDREFKWYALDHVYNAPGLKSLVSVAREHRKFFWAHLRDLSEIVSLAQKLLDSSEKYNIPISEIEIMNSDNHGVGFEQLFPMHLLHRLNGEAPVPIQGLPYLNGQITCLTGPHGKGKTVSTLTIPAIIYLAQSGIPPLGRNYRQNIKKILAVVAIDNAEGSLATRMLEQMKKVLLGIQKANGKEVVVVIDELGEGTQESAGFELGKDFLNKLQSLGVTVIFNTQITALAEISQKDLNAGIFKVSEGYQILPGIADGDMAGLRQRTGFDKLVKV